MAEAGGVYRYAGGGGGSGFVWTESTSNNVPEGYLAETKYYLTDTILLDGNSNFETKQGNTTGNEGNGYAVIETLEEVNMIVLLRNLYTRESVNISNDKNVVLDLNGKNIEIYSETFITNNGKLKIIDNSTFETGILESTSGTIIGNSETGELEINGGTIKGKKNGTTEERTETIENEGKVILTGGTISNIGTAGSGIYNKGKGTLEINDGTIDSKGSSSYGIYNVSTETVIINGETIKITGITAGICNISTGTMEIKGETIKAEGYGIWNGSSGKILIEGGNITGVYGVYNTETGNIKIGGGNIKSTSSSGYGIYNNSTGEIEINEGIINGSYYGIYNNNTGTVRINEGTIESINTSSYSASYNSSYTIYNANTGTIKMQGGEINSYNDGKSKSYGIYNNSTGKIEVTSGAKINAIRRTGEEEENTFGIYNYSTGEITIGEKGNGVSIETPEIRGETYGVYNQNGTLNFYDGIIKGKTMAIYGSISEVEETYEVIKDTQEEYECAYLSKGIAVAKIGDTTYMTLSEAISACPENIQTTIEILRNVNIGADIETYEIKTSQDIIIDLKGYYITASKELIIRNQGKLKIIDSSEEKTGILENTAGVIISNLENGELEINGGTIRGTKNGTSGELAKTIENEGKLIQTGGTIINIGSLGSGIYNKGTGTVEINDGTIEIEESARYGIYNISTGTARINGGTINSNNYGIWNGSNGKVLIEGGNITGHYGVYNNGTGNIEIGGGNITGYYGVYNNGTGNIKIGGGNIKDSYYGIYNNSTGEIEINGGNIEGNGSRYGIYNYSTGKIIINEGTIENTYSSSNFPGYGIYNEKAGTVKMQGGKINCYNSQSNKCYGIYNNSTGKIEVTSGAKINAIRRTGEENENTFGIYNYSTGEITIGEEGNGVSIEIPEVSGESYGVYNPNGTLNFYDGIIKGKTMSIYGSISEVEETYEVIKEIQEEYECAYLAKDIVVAKIGDITYMTISEAINACPDNIQTTIEILRNANIVANIETYEIKATQDIIIDLKGYHIMASNESSITNQGKLKIIDSSEGKIGLLENTAGATINNLELGELEIYSGTIKGKAKTTENEGKLLQTGGTISSIGTSGCGIYNKGTGTVEIMEGTIDVQGRGIYNVGTGTVKINGESIKINAGYAGISNISTGTIELKEGTINSQRYGIWDESNGKVLIEGGNIIALDSGVYNNGTGNVKIDGGKITARSEAGYGINNRSTGEIEINAGSINSPCYGIYNNSTGMVRVNDVTIQIDNSHDNYSKYGIYNNRTGTIKIQGGEINSYNDGTTRCYGIYNYTGKIEIANGVKINAIRRTGKEDNNTYGIYNYSTGEITIGEKGNGVSIETPEISGETYGVYNPNGILNFYDGIIKGKTAAISGYITEVEPYYGINVTTVEDYITATLVLVPTDDATAFVNGNYYNDLQAAIDSCTENVKYYIMMMNGASTTNGFIIPEGKDITIELNGYVISSSNEATIINNGTLGIKDSNTLNTGAIRNTTGVAIQNNGTMILGIDDEIISTSIPLIEGKTYGINNASSSNNIYFYDGTVKATTEPINSGNIIVPTGYEIQTTTVDGIKQCTIKEQI